MKKSGHLLGIIVNFLTAIALASIVVLVFINVILRYFFNSGLTWSEEVAVNLFVWVIFLGAIMAARDGLHIRVDVFVSRLPKGLQKIFLLLANFLVLIGLAVLMHGGIKVVKVTHASISPATGIPFSYITISLVVSAIGIGLITMYQTYKTLQR